jgi:uncharacterized membrane protein YccC
MRNFLTVFKNSIKNDKKSHFLVGSLLTFLLFSFLIILQKPFDTSLVISIIVVQCVALGKEVYDSLFPAKHTTEFDDYTATVAGGFLVVSLLLIIKSLKEVF